MTVDFRGAVFDVDGVLLDSLPVWQDLGSRYLRSLGVTPEEGLDDELFAMSMEQGAEYLRKHYALRSALEEVSSGLSKMLETFYYDEVQAKEGADVLLKGFKKQNIPVTLATSSPRDHVTKALERTGLLKYVDKIFTTEELQSSKHSSDIYYDAAGFMNTDPGKTLVFEDSLYALRTAAEAGFFTIGVYDPAGEPDQEGLKKACSLYVRDLNEAAEKLI